MEPASAGKSGEEGALGGEVALGAEGLVDGQAVQEAGVALAELPGDLVGRPHDGEGDPS